MASSSSSRKYDVFISHAGEDKATIAIPLRNMLSGQGITAFVDEKDIRRGNAATPEMTSAMENADVAVIILSPEYVAKKWPMKELLFFLHRRENAQAKGESLPVIIPVFYRLSVADLYNEPDLERKTAQGTSLYRVTRFFERRDNGEPEADVEIIRRALRAVHEIMGVVNKYHASNDVSSTPSRQLLLQDACAMISQIMEEHELRTAQNEDCSTTNTTDDTEHFRTHFCTESLRQAVLDFDGLDERGEPVTHEGRIKRRVLNSDRDSDKVFALLGGGGVGKSTILKALRNDRDLRERFCDGIHFISLGMESTAQTLVEELLRVLHDAGATKAAAKLRTEKRVGVAIEETVRYALQWFEGRSCLFLVDDVWVNGLGLSQFAHVGKLGCVGTLSCVVFTTREREMSSVATNQESILRVTPRKAQGKESRDILFCHAGINEADVGANSSITGILGICAGLPVSLAAAGKGAKMMAIDMGTHIGNVWRVYLNMLRTCREQLLREEVGEYGNLYITLRASIALLEGREGEKLGFETRAGFAEMHRRLCIFRKHGGVFIELHRPLLPFWRNKRDFISTSILKHLWELSSESEAAAVGMLFVEVGLADCELREVRGRYVWHLGLHDSIHDFAVSEAKRHGDAARSHRILLGGYGGSRLDSMLSFKRWRKWWARECEEDEDEYVHRNLCHHLRGTKCAFLLHLVVCNQARCWGQCQLLATCWTYIALMWLINLQNERDVERRDVIGSTFGGNRSLYAVSELLLRFAVFCLSLSLTRQQLLVEFVCIWIIIQLIWIKTSFESQPNAQPFDCIRGHSLVISTVIGLLTAILMVLILYRVMPRRPFRCTYFLEGTTWRRGSQTFCSFFISDKHRTMCLFDYRWLLMYLMSRGK